MDDNWKFVLMALMAGLMPSIVTVVAAIALWIKAKAAEAEATAARIRSEKNLAKTQQVVADLEANTNLTQETAVKIDSLVIQNK